MSNLIDIHAVKLVFMDAWLFIKKDDMGQYAEHLDQSIIDLLDCKELIVFGTDLEEFLKIKNMQPNKDINSAIYVFDTPLYDLFYYFLMADYE